jgi:hypothetical protein
LPTVCHERTKGFYTPKCGAAQEMRVGPSESTFRSRFQTTLSCAGKEPGDEIPPGYSTLEFCNTKSDSICTLYTLILQE